MKDPTRGNTYVNDIGNGYRGVGTIVVDGDNKWGNGTNSRPRSAAVDAAYGFAKTWDFYKESFGALASAATASARSGSALREELQQRLLERRLLLHGLRRRRRRLLSVRWWRSTSWATK